MACISVPHHTEGLLLLWLHYMHHLLHKILSLATLHIEQGGYLPFGKSSMLTISECRQVVDLVHSLESDII